MRYSPGANSTTTRSPGLISPDFLSARALSLAAAMLAISPWGETLTVVSPASAANAHSSAAIRILDMQQEYFVIEKTGTAEQTQELLEKLRPLGILEFIRSGRVIITKPMKTLDEYMDEKDQSYSFTN